MYVDIRQLKNEAFLQETLKFFEGSFNFLQLFLLLWLENFYHPYSDLRETENLQTFLIKRKNS